MSTPLPAGGTARQGANVELGDTVTIKREPASYSLFRRDGRFAEMVEAELAGHFEAPIYGMLAVQNEIPKIDWGASGPPEIHYHGQPLDESKPSVLWDGGWEVTYVTFRDMGAAFAVAILGIYLLVVAQFGSSFRLPLVVLIPVPLTFIGIVFGHWLLAAPLTATSMIGFIALAGIIVRNSILLVDFANQLFGQTGRPKWMTGAPFGARDIQQHRRTISLAAQSAAIAVFGFEHVELKGDRHLKIVTPPGSRRCSHRESPASR